jgi:hypothetical protein
MRASMPVDFARLDCIANQNSKKQVFFYFRRMRARVLRERFGLLAIASPALHANPGGPPAGKKIASGC